MQHFRSIYITILFQSAKNYKTKYNTFHHENTQEKRTYQIASNQSSDTAFKDFTKLYKDCT